MVLKSDGDNSISAWVHADAERIHTDGEVKPIGVETSPLGNHQSDGMAEITVQLTESMAKICKLVMEQKY